MVEDPSTTILSAYLIDAFVAISQRPIPTIDEVLAIRVGKNCGGKQLSHGGGES